MTRQKEQEDQIEKKNKRGDRKGESNDSPEIPDRRRTSDIPGLPSWLRWGKVLSSKYVIPARTAAEAAGNVSKGCCVRYTAQELCESRGGRPGGDEVERHVLGCRLKYQGQTVTSAKAWFSVALRPQKP